MAKDRIFKKYLNNLPAQNETREKVRITSQSAITKLIKPAIVFKETYNLWD